VISAVALALIDRFLSPKPAAEHEPAPAGGSGNNVPPVAGEPEPQAAG
jgi:hypothetical protein